MTTANPRDAIALQALRATYPTLDGWRDRSRTLELPQPGSELDGDTSIWPNWPPHQMARVSLIAAVQHLNLARAAVEQHEVFPIAHPTVLRGALLSAARATWLLSPDDGVERQQRALRVIHESYRRLRQYVASGATDRDATETASLLSDLDTRLTDIRAKWTVLASGETGAVSETTMVGVAGQASFTDAAMQARVASLWMQWSGDAHGLGWPMLTRAGTTIVTSRRLAGYPEPMGEYTSGADLYELVDGFTGAFRMLTRGWSWFDQRCEATK